MNNTQLPRLGVSVVIPAYFSAAQIAACLDSLRKQSFDGAEIIVVNSSPDQETGMLLRTRFPEVRFIQSPARLLPHAARNVGAAHARGDLILFTDPDCIAAPDWLARMVAANAEGFDVLAGAIDCIPVTLTARTLQFVKYSFYLPGLPAGAVDVAASTNCLYSRRAWLRAGPFDGSIFCGDAVLTWSAKAAGFTPRFVPEALVYHQDQAFDRDFLRQRYQRGIEFGRVRSSREHWSRPRLVACLVLAPLTPLLLLARGLRQALRAGLAPSFALTAPLQGLAHLCWCLGEARAYAGILTRRGAQ